MMSMREMQMEMWEKARFERLKNNSEYPKILVGFPGIAIPINSKQEEEEHRVREKKYLIIMLASIFIITSIFIFSMFYVIVHY